MAIALTFAGTAFAGLAPYVPSDSWAPLHDPPTYEAKLRQVNLLGGLGSSFDGIRYLIQHGDELVPSLAPFTAALPANLTVEPGLSNLALATQAYLALYGGPAMALYGATNAGQQVPLNSFFHIYRLYINSGFIPVANGVSLYSFAGYSLANGPLLLELPPYSGGYFVVPFYDIYGLTFASLGSAHGNAGGGKWLIATHDWAWEGDESDLPEGLVGIIRSPTIEGGIVGRTNFNGTGAGPWTLTWKLEPWAPAAKPVLPPPPQGLGYGYPDQDPKALFATNPSDPLAFWRLAGEVYRRNGGPSIPQPLAAQLTRLGLYRDYGFIPYGLSANVSDALALAPILATRILVARYTFLGSPATNYWHLPVNNGDWGNDYVLGAAIMKGFWVSNLLRDAAYYYQYLDASATPLHGNNTYTLEFPAAPPATSQAFWSLVALDLDNWTLLFGPDFANQPLTSAGAGLYVRPNGSIPIRVQAKPPPANTTAEGRGWNWVQSYPGNFQLILRVYAGGPSVLANTYVPPPVVRVVDVPQPSPGPSLSSPSPVVASPSPSPSGNSTAPAGNSTSPAAH
ncbi:hypothetical protein HXX76_012211 [Chlamydomonas incerta]|uniref:Uncharacterized protein n=1 Tax=Chlamydomonas incerta TaxID=51695 RepID=A0A835VSF7_CHLIN|nr:hypothetical protein HXX76_012211 [Chlamydomonas incerta]|eukprot:KAG2427557.1 hypothetical protein HXX76_012211 [Chlamydomonas incerta]